MTKRKKSSTNKNKQKDDELHGERTRNNYPIKKIREELKMTQLEFANAIGVTPGSVSRWERGIHEPIFTMFQMKRLCRLTGRFPDDFPDILGKDCIEENEQT